MKTASFPTLLERFFLERLRRQRQASPHTISSYRDPFRLLLQFAQRRLHKPPSDLSENHETHEAHESQEGDASETRAQSVTAR